MILIKFPNKNDHIIIENNMAIKKKIMRIK
jgi:hypothetical protein